MPILLEKEEEVALLKKGDGDVMEANRKESFKEEIINEAL